MAQTRRGTASRNTTNRTRTSSRNAYIYDTAARQSDVRRQLQEAPKKQLSNETRKNREKASKLDLTYTVFLVISVVVTVAVCVGYLSLQNEITRTNVQIATLKSQLSTITNENAAMEERINSAIDLSQVYQAAVNEYGMTAIKEDQIHYYSNENEDYVKQYEQIPTDE